MPKERAPTCTSAFAGWLERAAGDRVAEYEEILGYHLEQAYRYRTELGPATSARASSAARRGRAIFRSGERANQAARFDATLIFERAVPLLDGDERALAIVELGVMHEQLGDYAKAVEVLDSVRRVRGRRTAPGSAGPRRAVRDVRARPAGPLGRDRALREHSGTSADGGGGAGRRGGQDGVHRRARVGLVLGGPLRRRAPQRRADPRQRGPAPADRAARHGVPVLSDACFGSAPVDESFELLERALDVLGGTVFADLVYHNNRAALYAMLDRPDDFDRELATLIGSSPRSGRNGRSSPPARRSSARAASASDDSATPRPSSAPRRRSSMNAVRRPNANITSELGVLLIELGHAPRGRAPLDRRREADARRRRLRRAHRDLLGDALLASADGDHDAALAAADAAWAHLAPTDYLCFQAKTHAIRGEVLAAAGRADEAAAAFAESIALYERKGSVADIHRLREAHPELG